VDVQVAYTCLASLSVWSCTISFGRLCKNLCLSPASLSLYSVSADWSVPESIYVRFIKLGGHESK
jgi:hypothetical protein